MSDNIKELEEEYRKTTDKIEELVLTYEQMREQKFEKYKVCCEAVCAELIALIKKQKATLKTLKSTVEKAPRATHLKLHKAIHLEEERIKELEYFRDQLYGKAICNCKQL